MSEPSSEPEKYTIDEMMDRLKNRDSADPEGELVTRSDGSQARKIKKRKRRSNQAVNKETKRNQKVQAMQIAGFVVLIAVAGLAIGVGVLYANSTAFRESLIKKIGKTTEAKVEGTAALAQAEAQRVLDQAKAEAQRVIDEALTNARPEGGRGGAGDRGGYSKYQL